MSEQDRLTKEEREAVERLRQDADPHVMALLDRLAPKPAPVVPKPEELVVQWRAKAECYLVILLGCADELERSLAAHPRPVARELTRTELLEVHYTKSCSDDLTWLDNAIRKADELRGLR